MTVIRERAAPGWCSQKLLAQFGLHEWPAKWTQTDVDMRAQLFVSRANEYRGEGRLGNQARQWKTKEIQKLQEAGKTIPRAYQSQKRGRASEALRVTTPPAQQKLTLDAPEAAPGAVVHSGQNISPDTEAAPMPEKPAPVTAPDVRTVDRRLKPLAGHQGVVDEDHWQVTLVLFALCAGAAVAGFFMAWDALEANYPGVTSLTRAIGLLSCDLVAFHFAIYCYRRGHIKSARALFALVLVCAAVDVALAHSKAATTIKGRQDHIEAQYAEMPMPVPTTKCDPQKPQQDYGAQRLPMWQKSEKARMDKCTADQKEEVQLALTTRDNNKQARLKLTEGSGADEFVAWVLPLICMIAGGASTPLFEELIVQWKLNRKAALAARKARRVSAPRLGTRARTYRARVAREPFARGLVHWPMSWFSSFTSRRTR